MKKKKRPDFNRTEDNKFKKKFKGKKTIRDKKVFKSKEEDQKFKKKKVRKTFGKKLSQGETPSYAFHKYKDLKKRTEEKPDHSIRLNKYIANAGICSRREADKLIEQGLVEINGVVMKEMGYQVKTTDRVVYNGKKLSREKLAYILLNKPKNYITTMDDPKGRRTVMDLLQNACEQRVYPVGRLDRNTVGLLLFTNDGEVADKLMHPSNKIKKIYEVTLNKPIDEDDFDAIKAGIELEDGLAEVDDLALIDSHVLGIEIHIGRNRIVRRIFEHLGYDVVKLDRTVYAGLNKKDLPRSKWRFLTEQEVINLKF